jgi:nucleoside-diphosphate-sugar epimerase
MLRHHGLPGVAPLWQVRDGADHRGAVVFDPLAMVPALPACAAVLCLSGVISGPPQALRANVDLALAALRIGLAAGARRVFLASSAAVYGGQGAPLTEDMAPHPLSDYGHAKARMEAEALDYAARLGLPVTILRIGNVAGADALLGQAPDAAITLDRFADGQGPRRSYIGPGDLAAVMAALLAAAAAGQALPAVLNLSLPGAVAMADLLQAAGRPFAWRAAPDCALPLVMLDTARLSGIVALPQASAARIVADWQAYRVASA